jgi:hypothetical protein
MAYPSASTIIGQVSSWRAVALLNPRSSVIPATTKPVITGGPAPELQGAERAADPRAMGAAVSPAWCRNHIGAAGPGPGE